ncbi:MAG: methyltransferase domain-containing protein [Deltaproteobacteria bacterium]|nr:methyltransferase domain-containing protein [Deltaproteobacteria bacterium]
MIESIPTRGRTLDMASVVYDLLEPLCLLGQQKKINNHLVSLLDVKSCDKVLDVGCGTGVLTKLISEKMNPTEGGYSLGIDAAGKMISAARKKRGNTACKFEAMAAESLSFENETFDSIVSSFFYHHIQFDLKQKAFAEAYRVLKPGGKLIIADMHIPTSFMGALTAHTSRWILFQPQIGENIRGVLPELIENEGFSYPKTVENYLGYVTVFSANKGNL